MKPVYYSKWPRRDNGALLFESTHDALFYAAQIYNNDVMIESVQKDYNRSLESFELMQPVTWRNLTHLVDITFDLQFYRECLEQIQHLREYQDKNYSLPNSAVR
ncbi:hypothetical protein LCGC14_0817730 [marine sediment metagenome]|uniref:Uncharacterized protein n=1 Tax=marine sediment metagenome TaxID=412755 RepID=A0A0F9PPE6_9ZZZZ